MSRYGIGITAEVVGSVWSPGTFHGIQIFFLFPDSGGDANSNYGNVTRPYSMQPSPSHPMHGGDVQNGASDENWRSHGEGRVGK